MISENQQITDVFPVSCEHIRLAKSEDIHAKMLTTYDKRGIFRQPLPTLEETIMHVLSREEIVKSNILICGSFFIMKDVRKALNYPYGKLDECDD